MEASFFVYWKPTVRYRSFIAYGLDRFPLAPHAPWFISPGTTNAHAQGDPQMHQRVRGANRALNSALAGGELRDIAALSAISMLTDPV
jgi:hypothetical protein